MNWYIQSRVECYLPASQVKHLQAGASVDHNNIFGHFNLVAFARNILNEVLRDNLISDIIAQPFDPHHASGILTIGGIFSRNQSFNI